MDTFAEENPKNYQIWYHRRAIVELLADASREIKFCNKVFKIDAKNYHAWAHRQFIVKTYNLWEGEIEYTDSKIEEDLRNNSAWNHRLYFYFRKIGLYTIGNIYFSFFSLFHL